MSAKGLPNRGGKLVRSQTLAPQTIHLQIAEPLVYVTDILKIKPKQCSINPKQHTACKVKLGGKMVVSLIYFPFFFYPKIDALKVSTPSIGLTIMSLGNSFLLPSKVNNAQ